MQLFNNLEKSKFLSGQTKLTYLRRHIFQCYKAVTTLKQYKECHCTRTYNKPYQGFTRMCSSGLSGWSQPVTRSRQDLQQARSYCVKPSLSRLRQPNEDGRSCFRVIPHALVVLPFPPACRWRHKEDSLSTFLQLVKANYSSEFN